MKKILILEDNPAMLEQLSMIVHELDIKVQSFAFSNVRDAYRCAMEKKIDVFIVDIILEVDRLGDVSGLKFIGSLRNVKHYSFTPMIIVTSLEDAKAYTYEKLHCYSFIEKPFDVEKVKHTIQHCLAFPDFEEKERTLFFRKEGILYAVENAHIVFAESTNHVMHIYTDNGDVLKIPYFTLKRLLEEIDRSDMIQCSRNTIVNKKYISNVDFTNRIIQLRGDYKRIEIGVHFKKYVKEHIK